MDMIKCACQRSIRFVIIFSLFKTASLATAISSMLLIHIVTFMIPSLTLFKLFWRKWGNGWNMGWIQMPRSSPILWPLGCCWLLQFSRWRRKIFQGRSNYKRIVSKRMRGLLIMNTVIKYDNLKAPLVNYLKLTHRHIHF